MRKKADSILILSEQLQYGSRSIARGASWNLIRSSTSVGDQPANRGLGSTATPRTFGLRSLADDVTHHPPGPVGVLGDGLAGPGVA